MSRLSFITTGLLAATLAGPALAGDWWFDHQGPLRDVTTIIAAIAKKDGVALVVCNDPQVRCDLMQPPTEGAITCQVMGRFEAVKWFGGSARRYAPWDIAEVMDVSTQWGGSELYHRLKPLLNGTKPGVRCQFLVTIPRQRPASDEPRLAEEAVPYRELNPREEYQLLGGAFYGPLDDKDAEMMGALVECLQNAPYQKMRRETARRLLRSGNPFLIYLGLARLREMEHLTARDFPPAWLGTPLPHLPALVRTFFRVCPTADDVKGVTIPEAIATFLKDAPADRQAVFLGLLLEGEKKDVLSSPVVSQTVEALLTRQQGNAAFQEIILKYAEFKKLLEAEREKADGK